VEGAAQSKVEQMLLEVDVSHLADFCDGYNQAVKIEYVSGQEEL
jgi:hypothetical protein